MKLLNVEFNDLVTSQIVFWFFNGGNYLFMSFEDESPPKLKFVIPSTPPIDLLNFLTKISWFILNIELND